MATSEAGAAGALVRGIRPDDLRSLPLLANHIVQGSLDRFRRRRRRGRRPAGAPARARRRQPDHLAVAGGHRHRFRHDAARQDLPCRRALQCRHVRIRQQLYLRAARCGAAVLPPARGGLQPRSLHRRPRPGARAAPADHRRARRAGADRRLAAGQFEPLQRGRDRAQRDVPDPDIDHRRRRVQHHLQHDHDGEGQGARHRDPAHDGRLTRDDPAHLRARAAPASGSSARSRGLSSVSSSPTTSKRSDKHFRGSSAPICSPPKSISSPASRPGSTPARSPPS